MHRCNLLSLLFALFAGVVITVAADNSTQDDSSRGWITGDAITFMLRIRDKNGNLIGLGAGWNSRYVVTAESVFPNWPRGVTEDVTMTLEWPAAPATDVPTESRYVYLDDNLIVADRIPIAVIRHCPALTANYRFSFGSSNPSTVGQTVTLETFDSSGVVQVSNQAVTVADKSTCAGEAWYSTKSYILCLSPMADALNPATDLGAVVKKGTNPGSFDYLVLGAGTTTTPSVIVFTGLPEVTQYINNVVFPY